MALTVAVTLLAAMVAPSLLAASGDPVAETDEHPAEAQVEPAEDSADAIAPQPEGVEDAAEAPPSAAGEPPSPEPQGTGAATARGGKEGDRPVTEPASEPRASRERRGARAAQAAASGAVTIRNFAFAPRETTVRAGETVSWTNRDREPHDAEAFGGSFKTRVLQRGQSDSVTFSNPGTFRYFCSIHPPSQFPNFTGTVRVVGDGGGGGGAAAAEGDTAGGATAGGEEGTGEQAGAAGQGGAAHGSTLPATGLGLVPLSGLGLALLATGALLRRLRSTD